MAQPCVVKADILERARLLNDLTVTLHDWMADDGRDGRNLIAANRDGLEVWRAKPDLHNIYIDRLVNEVRPATFWERVIGKHPPPPKPSLDELERGLDS